VALRRAILGGIALSTLMLTTGGFSYPLPSTADMASPLAGSRGTTTAPSTTPPTTESPSSRIVPVPSTTTDGSYVIDIKPTSAGLGPRAHPNVTIDRCIVKEPAPIVHMFGRSDLIVSGPAITNGSLPAHTFAWVTPTYYPCHPSGARATPGSP